MKETSTGPMDATKTTIKPYAIRFCTQKRMAPRASEILAKPIGVKDRKIYLRQQGLTLIEVIFAIILFAGAMITLLGLQSSNLARTREDRNKVRAMLAAREILSAIEIQEEPLETGTKDGTVDEVFEGLLAKPPLADGQKDPHEGLTAQLEIENIALPEIGETALQKITVTIFWGNGPFDLFKTSYFTPGTLAEAPVIRE